MNLAYSPHSARATCVAFASTTPTCTDRLPVSMSIALSAILNPASAWSTASTVRLVPLYARRQHVPHAVEFQPATACAPPMRGALGSEPKVVKPLVRRPLAPLVDGEWVREW